MHFLFLMAISLGEVCALYKKYLVCNMITTYRTSFSSITANYDLRGRDASQQRSLKWVQVPTKHQEINFNIVL